MFPGDYCLATMTDYELTNLARIPLLMLEYAEQSGMDRDELLRLASITPATLADRDTRLPMSALLRLWRAILKRQEGTAIGVRIGSTLTSLGAPNENFVDTVRRALWSELPGGRPNLWRTASGLGISARTLQRRLRENGTSFSAVLEELRREFFGELLADKKLAVSDVALLLGYSEPSAFQRAFRRWRGVSPR